MIHQAVGAELAGFFDPVGERRKADGRAGVVRNGYLPERELQTGLGPVTVKIPKVRVRTGEAVSFRSAWVPPYVCKTKSLEAAEKHFLAIEDGGREPTQSRREVLLKLKARGMNVPEPAIGDGAMGFWAALEEVYGETRRQRSRRHKTMSGLNRLPKSAQPQAERTRHAVGRCGKGL